MAVSSVSLTSSESVLDAFHLFSFSSWHLFVHAKKKTVLCFTRRRRRCRHMKSPPFSIPSFNGFWGIKPRWIMENFTQDDKSVMGLEVLKQDGSHYKLPTRLDLYPGVGRSWPGKSVRCHLSHCLFPSNGCSAIWGFIKIQILVSQYLGSFRSTECGLGKSPFCLENFEKNVVYNLLREAKLSSSPFMASLWVRFWTM